MPRIPLAATLAAAVLCAATAFAQQASPPGGWASGMGPRSGHGPRFGSDFTPGWSMMSPRERDEHRQRILGAGSREECQKLRDEHMQWMKERAKARGLNGPPAPRRDPCAGMRP